MRVRSAGHTALGVLACVALFLSFPRGGSGQPASPEAPNRAELTSEITLRVDGVTLADLWRALAKVTGRPVVAFLPEDHPEVTVDITGLPLGRALSRIAVLLDASWRTRAGIIVFGPLPPAVGDAGSEWTRLQNTVLAWAATLTEAQMDDFARGRLLPVEALTPEQRSLLEQADPSRGASLRKGGADAIPAVGVFFAPYRAVYAGEQIEGVEVARPAGLLKAPRQPPGDDQPPVPVVPPMVFMKDADGYLVPRPPGTRRYDADGNLLPSTAPPPAPRDEPPARTGGPLVSLTAGDRHQASAVLSAIRDQAGQSVDTDVEALDRDLFASPGPYDAADLLVAVCHATGCVRLRDGQTEYLARTDAEAREIAGLPPLPDRFARRRVLTRHFRYIFARLTEEFDYTAAGVPFGPDDFLDGERMPLESFTPAQQAFLHRQFSDELLPITEVRLFPTFSVTLASFSSRVPPMPDGRVGKLLKSEETWCKMHENQWHAQGTLYSIIVW